MVHWLLTDQHPKGCTYPHTEPADDCPGCKKGQAPRWKGYVGAILATNKEKCIIEITEYAYRQITSYIHPTEGLRGQVISLRRLGNHGNAKVAVAMAMPGPSWTAPEEFDEIPHLENLWGIGLSQRRTVRRVKDFKIVGQDGPDPYMIPVE